MAYGCSVKWTFTTQQAQNEWELSFQDAWHCARWERNMVSALSVRGSLSPQEAGLQDDGRAESLTCSEYGVAWSKLVSERAFWL